MQLSENPTSHILQSTYIDPSIIYHMVSKRQDFSISQPDSVDTMYLSSARICVLGSPDGWFFKYNTRVHVDQVLHAFALNCPNLTALEIQWDPETLRFSDKSRKFIDRLRCI